MKKLFLLIAFIICNEFFVYGFFNQTKYKLYSKDDGLNNNTVSAIFQDSEGYLWLGTDIGLTRSDGVNFHHYTFAEAGGSFITNITPLDNSLLWCWSNGYIAPVCFDTSTGKAMPVTGLEKAYLQTLKDFAIMEGKMYALHNGCPVQISIEYTKTHINLRSEEMGLGNNVRKLFHNSNSLYLLTDSSLVEYNPINGQRRNLSVLDKSDMEKAEKLKFFGDNIFIFGKALKPSCFNTKTNEHIRLNTGDPIIDIEQIDSSRYIFATWNSISVLEFENGNITSKQSTLGLFDKLAPYARIFRNSIEEMYYDSKNQVLWVGITGKGLMKISFRGERLKHIEIPQEIKTVNGLTQDINGHIWITTDTRGIFRSNSNRLSPKMDFTRWNTSKEGRYIQHQDEFGNLWFGDSHGLIIKYNPVNGNADNLKVEYTHNGEKAEAKTINAIYLNTRNRLWIAAENGLYVYDANQKKFLAYMPADNTTGIITDICQDGGGNMWLGTERGVFLAQRDGETINLTSGFEESANVAPTKVLDLYVNNFNHLYASYEDKTIHIDAKTRKVVETMMLHRDYSSGHIYCITDDGSGCTWLGTAAGVVMVNNETLESYLYELSESFTEVQKLKGGQLLWATSNGLLFFTPDDIKNWVGNRELIVSDLEVNYRNFESEVAHTYRKDLVFDHNENNLHIYVSDLRFGASSNKVEYRLLPADTIWKSTYSNCVELRDLESGKYTLELRSPHITSQTPPVTRMNFTIKPLWFLSLWGIIICAGTILALLAASYFLFIYRLRHKKKLSSFEQTILEELNEKNNKEERALLRSRLRHEIVQKLRTPISLIIAPLREISSDSTINRDIKLKSNIALLNSVIVQEICTRLEDLFLLEKEDIYKVAPYEVSKISNSTVSPLREVFNTSTVKVYFDKERRSNRILWVDRTRISFLLRSLLVHALQQLEYTGEMWLEVRDEVKDGKPMCIFAIRTRKLAKIQKDRSFSLCKDYEEAMNQKLLGWQLLQYIATMHKADVYFKESVETGLEVALHLPVLSKKEWEGMENVMIVEPLVAENEQEALASIIVDEASVDLNIGEQENGTDGDNRIKLLVIEDNPDIRLYMKVMFSKQYKVLFAENGEEGIRTAVEEIPNLILTDIMMPGVDGYEVLRIVKEDARTCHIPVILLTALTGEDDIIKGFDLGADDYITKPFNPDILRAKVRQLVKERGELKQIYSQLLNSTNETLGQMESKGPEEDPFITKINELVIANIQNPDFNVKELASMLYMSQPTLYRKVKQITGYTIIEVVRAVRLKQAAELLKTRKYGIQEVAELVGYNDVPTFRKHFVALYGTTPSAFSASGGETGN